MNQRLHRAWPVLTLACLFLVGCHHYENEQFSPVIIDRANVLTEASENQLRAFKYPRGFAFVVMTEPRIAPEIVGAFADARFKALFKDDSRKDAFRRRGVLFLVSESPRLIQIRMGSDFHSLAQWRGLTSGRRYLEKQLAARERNHNAGILDMVQWAAADLPTVVDLPWYRKWMLFDIVQSLGMELDALSAPSESFYGVFLLRPITAIRVFERNRFGSWWMTYVLIAVACYVLRRLLDLLFVNPIRRWRPAVGNTIGLLLAIAIGVGFAFPSAGSAILLAGSRLEDQIALKASGLRGVDQLSFALGAFDQRTGAWLALLLVPLRILKGFADRGWMAGLAGLSNEHQRVLFRRTKEQSPLAAFLLQALGSREGKTIEISEDDYLNQPYTHSYLMPVVDDFWAGVRWGFLASLFLPMALSLAVAYFWLVPIATGGFTTARSLWTKDSVAKRLIEERATS